MRLNPDQNSRHESSASRAQSPSPIYTRMLTRNSGTARSSDLASQLEGLFQEKCQQRKVFNATTRIPPGSIDQSATNPGSILIPDLVGLLATKIGSLGSQHIEESGRFGSVLSSNISDTMFDNVQVGHSPLGEYDSRKTKQLIDVWYSAHPMRVVVSKTLFLRDLRNEAQGRCFTGHHPRRSNLSHGRYILSR